jgi:hypothetical protein
MQRAVIKNLSIGTILRLMDYRTFKGRVGPEDRLTIEVATMLRVATVEGRLRATWSHLPHEAAGKGKFAAIYMAKAKAMGLIKGSADLVFVWAGGGGWIELKTETGSLTKEQREFRDWCIATGCNHALCRSVEEVQRVLAEWGVLVSK